MEASHHYSSRTGWTAGNFNFFIYFMQWNLHDILNVRSFSNINFQFQQLDFCLMFGDIQLTFGVDEEYQDSV